MKKLLGLFLCSCFILSFCFSVSAKEKYAPYKLTPEDETRLKDFFDAERELLKERNTPVECEYEMKFRVYGCQLWSDALNNNTVEEYLNKIQESEVYSLFAVETSYDAKWGTVFSGPVLFPMWVTGQLEKHMPHQESAPYGGPLEYKFQNYLDHYVELPYAFFSADMESEHAALFALYPEAKIQEIYYLMGDWEATGTPDECLIIYVTDQGTYGLLYRSDHGMFGDWINPIFEVGKTYLMSLDELFTVIRPSGERIRAYLTATEEAYQKELERQSVVPDNWETQSVSYEVDYDGLVQAALEKKAAQSVSAENGAEPKDAAPVGAPQTPAVVELTAGEEPESSNALTWILGGAGVAVLAAAVIGWIWIRTRKRNESR